MPPSKASYDRLPLIAQALPDGVTLYPYYDQADLVNKAVAMVTDALLLAFVLIIIVLAIFLMNLRATVLVLLSIPLSIGLALTVMGLLGYFGQPDVVGRPGDRHRDDGGRHGGGHGKHLL